MGIVLRAGGDGEVSTHPVKPWSRISAEERITLRNIGAVIAPDCVSLASNALAFFSATRTLQQGIA